MWDMVAADLHATYGIDLADPPDRSWFWLLARIRRLLLDPASTTSRATRKG